MTVTTTLSDELRARIQALPFADRLFLLVGSIIGRDREAFSAISGLAELIVRMSGSFGDVNRFRVAEILRAAADRVEHETPAASQPLLNAEGN